MKKTAPSNLTPQRSNPAKPHAAEEKLRAIAAQEGPRTLAGQEERWAQASRTPAQIPAHGALVPAALVPTKAARDLKGVRDNPRDSGSAFRETPDCASVQVTDCASVQVTKGFLDCASAQVPPGICAFTQGQRRSSQALQEDCRALHEDCRALLAWYEKCAEEAEQRQQQQAEDFADWQQSRASGVLHPRSGGVLHRQTPAPARPLPLRAGKRTQLGRAHRHWDTPGGHLLVQVRLCEAVLLPKMRAQNAGERDAVNAQIAAALGLAAAADAGLLTGFLVFWQATGRWPRRPVSVQLFWPGGSQQGARLRGKYGPLLTHLQKEAQAHFNAERSK